jgi:hypothetical protein
VCEGCGHRTDLLPIHLESARGQIIQFPTFEPTVLAADPAEPAPLSTRQTG